MSEYETQREFRRRIKAELANYKRIKQERAQWKRDLENHRQDIVVQDGDGFMINGSSLTKLSLRKVKKVMNKLIKTTKHPEVLNLACEEVNRYLNHPGFVDDILLSDTQINIGIPQSSYFLKIDVFPTDSISENYVNGVEVQVSYDAEDIRHDRFIKVSNWLDGTYTVESSHIMNASRVLWGTQGADLIGRATNLGFTSIRYDQDGNVMDGKEINQKEVRDNLEELLETHPKLARDQRIKESIEDTSIGYAAEGDVKPIERALSVD